MKNSKDLVAAFVAGKGEGQVYISRKQADWIESLLSKERIRCGGAGKITWIPDTSYTYQRQYNGAAILAPMKTCINLESVSV